MELVGMRGREIERGNQQTPAHGILPSHDPQHPRLLEAREIGNKYAEFQIFAVARCASAVAARNGIPTPLSFWVMKPLCLKRPYVSYHQQRTCH
jgi:hypothetical protein